MPAASVVKWEELLLKEFEERIFQKPVVYLPLGLCEPHGHVAALGLDMIKANYLCEKSAFEFGGIVAPAQGYHIHETGYHAPWLADVLGKKNGYMTSMPPAPVLYHYLYQLRTFHNAGFKLALVLSGHGGGNQHDFRLASKLFMNYSDMAIEVFTDPELTKGKYAGDHAGKYEISQLMYLRPDLVELGRLSSWEASSPNTRFAQGEDAGCASAEYGREIITDCLNGVENLLNFHQQGMTHTARPTMLIETIEEIWRVLKEQSGKWVSVQDVYQNPDVS